MKDIMKFQTHPQTHYTHTLKIRK